MDKHTRDTIKRYQSATYASRYKKEYIAGFDFRSIRSRIIANREVAIIREFLGGMGLYGPEWQVVLDVPCGTGKLGSCLCRFPVKILAADVSRQMMDLASNEYDPEKLISFLQFDARNIPFIDGSVDNIVCLRLFQRIPREMRMNILREFRRVVRGNLIISYSYTSWFQRLRLKIRNLYDRERPTFFSESLHEITAELNEVGFAVKDKKYVLAGLSSEVIVIVRP